MPHYLTLPLFSHSPDILVPHLLGNLAVLTLFGGLSEIVLGSRRFAILTLTAAVVTAVPFVLVWRRAIEDRTARLCAGSGPENMAEGTETDRQGDHRSEAGPPDPALLEPDRPEPRPRWRGRIPEALGTRPQEVGSVITVTFSEDAVTHDVNVRRRSIWYQHEPAPTIDYKWLSPRVPAVELSRPLESGEALELEFDTYRAGPRGIPVPATVDIAYGKD